MPIIIRAMPPMIGAKTPILFEIIPPKTNPKYVIIPAVRENINGARYKWFVSASSPIPTVKLSSDTARANNNIWIIFSIIFNFSSFFMHIFNPISINIVETSILGFIFIIDKMFEPMMLPIMGIIK